ncbi:ATP-grasp domain-containing protein [Mangrovibacillus sp. Mu-81]|uniref:ATP-grasp domain-containing protein n=1 Tax=Mangrovibacillus sp. Mu-81 TaxID=3121478 RepID=UPI002FE4A796
MKEWMSMQTIIFLGTRRHGTSREALQVAKEMAYFTVLFTDKRGIGKKPDEFPEVDEIIFMEDIFLKEELMNKIQKLQVEGKVICACVSFIDPYVSYAAGISGELGLNPISSEALYEAESKVKVRKKLMGMDSSPTFFVFEKQVSSEEFAAAHKDFLPLILKPAESNGSKGIKLVKTEREMAEGMHYLQTKHPDIPILAEEYLEGPQYLIEVVVYRGEVSIIAVIEQECSKSFLIKGYKYPAELPAWQDITLKRTIYDMLFHMGLSTGSCHFEMRSVQGKWKLVEINPRMSGGAMNRLIEEGTGINLVKEILKMNVGEAPLLSPLFKKCTYMKYLTVDVWGKLLHVSGQDRALLLEGVKYVYVKAEKGSILSPPRSMGDRYACIITCAESIERARGIAREAAKELKFYVEPL